MARKPTLRPAWRTFLCYLSPENGCLSWKGWTDLDGYGRLTFQKHVYLAHRFVYEQAYGPITRGLVIDHLCRNRLCINPRHLEMVTPAENDARKGHARVKSSLFDKIIERETLVFLARLQKNGHCLIYEGARVSGYGNFGFHGRSIGAHRYAYFLAHGIFTSGRTQEIDHLCRNRACVRPDHLELVPPRINWERGESPQAVNHRKTHCIHGHEFTPENTYLRKGGHRACRTCTRESHQGSYTTEEAKEKRRQWYAEHQEQRREYQHQWDRTHRDLRNAYKRRWLKCHPETAKARRRRAYMQEQANAELAREKRLAWYYAHIEERRAYDRQYRARKKPQAQSTIPSVEQPVHQAKPPQKNGRIRVAEHSGFGHDG